MNHYLSPLVIEVLYLRYFYVVYDLALSVRVESLRL